MAKKIKLAIKKIKKRDGRIVPFEQEKITEAIFKAGRATGEFDHKEASRLSSLVVAELKKRGFDGEVVAVEQIQDIVEEALMRQRYFKTAKAYILYREQHKMLREFKGIDSDKLVSGYLEQLDWRVRENANMAFSLQGLNNEVASTISSHYWLNKIYPLEIRKAHLGAAIHIHNLQLLAPYCCGWDFKDLLVRGFGGVPGKVESRPPRHFRTALGQAVNFLYTLQGEIAGAVALANFDTYLAPFVRYDNLSYPQVKQAMQEFLYWMNVPTRVGFQTPFSNLTFDLTPPETVAAEPVVIGGTYQKENYGEFQKEMGMINRAFAEVMLEGDAKGRVFTFPIPTYNITKDFSWDDPNLEPVWEMTARYGIPYFANFVSSDMKPEDIRSMCCRLRLDTSQLQKRGGSLFASNPLTGSVGVVTINMARIGFLSRSKKEFFDRLRRLMDLAYQSLEIKRKTMEHFTEAGLFPYARHYLDMVKERFDNYWANHFSTIGLNGVNEALVNFMGEDIASKKGHKFALEILNFMLDKLLEYQEETGHLYNLEATPAESTTYIFAKEDKKRFPKIIVANEEVFKKGAAPFYSNSTHLPVSFTDDLFEALDLQDELQTKYTGGCVEKGNKVLTNKGLLKIEDIVKNFEKLRPIKAVSYNPEKGISEWDEIVDAVTINVEKKDKIRIKGERNLDIVTSDWHPFFVLGKIRVNPLCPICKETVGNIKGLAAHLRWNPECREKYNILPKYRVGEKRADELKIGDYVLQNSNNLYLKKQTELNNDLMWLIGFFIGDGCISGYIDNRGGNNLKKYKVRFNSDHNEALEKAGSILSRYFHCNAAVIQNDKRSKDLRELSTSKQSVLDFFFKYGFGDGKKVYDVYVPVKVKENLNKENVFSLLSGLMDSDGHIGRRDGDVEYYTVSPKLADDLLEICTRVGLMISKKKKKTHRSNEVDIYRLRIPAYQATKIRDRLANIVNPSRIKEDLSDRGKRHLPVVRVKEVSKVEVEDNQFYDLTTKKNHNYLAGKDSLVFIHNTVLHGFLGERLSNGETTKRLVKKIAENYRLPYFTFTPTFSICSSHGYIKGEQPKCPKCRKKTEVYSRVVGYLRPVGQWNPGKQSEFAERKEFVIR